MAGNRIKGITIEIGGNTTKLTDSLKKVDSSLKDTQSKLKDVNKLLKLDPTNVDLLKQKHDLLTKAVSDTKTRQEELKKALEQAKNAGDQGANIEQQNALQRELVETTAQLNALEKQLASSHPQLEAFSAGAAQVAEKTKGISTAAAGAAVALVGMGVKAAQSADDLATLSRNTGFSVEELQKMQYASDFVDVSMEAMTGSITKLTKNMSSGSDAFKTLGVRITDTQGNMRDATDVWYETLYALSKVENETERDALSMELFGKSAMELSGIIDDGGVALVNYGMEAEKTGLILSGDAVDAAVKFNDQVDKLKNTATQAFFSAGAALADSLVPALEKLVNTVVQVLSWFGQLDGTTQKVILTILALVASISPLAKLLSGLNTIVTVLSAAIGFLTSPIGLVIVAIGALIAIGVLLYKNWDTVKQKASELYASIKQTFANIYNSISSTIQNVIQFVANGFNSIKSTVTGIVSGIYGTVSSVFRNMAGTVSGTISGIAGTVSSIFGSIQSTISSVMNGAVGIVQGAVNAIRGAFNFSWSLPHLNLPHISVTGGVAPYGIGGKGSLPHFSISWYKKAYENAMLFTSPTVIPTATGFKGFGDGNGSEIVIGTNKLRELVGASGNNINVNVYAAQGMSETDLANAVAVKLDRWLGERL